MRCRPTSILITALALLNAACEPRTDGLGTTSEVEHRQKQAQMLATEVIDIITYIKDSRTGICFAYLWKTEWVGGTYRGGPALACIPCESVPPELLTIASEVP